MQPEKAQKIHFVEVVKPPLWLLAFIFFLLASLALSIWAAFDDRAGLIALVASIIVLFVVRKAMAMRIEIRDGELRVGGAHIELKYLANAQELSVNQMRLTRGRDADPAAYLALRFWQPHGVKVEVRDDRDPTPYWLISSKNTKGLVETLRKNQ